MLLSQVLPVAEELAARCASIPPRPGRGRRLGAPHGRDLQGHRPDRDGDRPGGAGAGARRAPARRPGRQRRRAGAAVVTHNGISVDLRIVAARRPRQPAPALHRLGRRTTSSCASARWPRGSRSPSTGSPRSRPARSSRYATEEGVYERLGLAYIEPELREGNGEIAAAADGRAPGAGRGRRHPRRPPLPHDALGRAQLARGDGRGGARPRLRLPGGHRPLRQPRLRRRRPADALLGADRGGRAR